MNTMSQQEREEKRSVSRLGAGINQKEYNIQDINYSDRYILTYT